MKVLNLACQQGHVFEGWFASEQDFQSQVQRQMVGCPFCSDLHIQKLPSAPRLNLGGARLSSESGADGSQSGDGRTPADVAHVEARAREGQLFSAMRELLAQVEDVGAHFAEEAKKMHYGEMTPRSIRGVATPEQTAELREEGIDVMALPIPSLLKETLQ